MVRIGVGVTNVIGACVGVGMMPAVGVNLGRGVGVGSGEGGSTRNVGVGVGEGRIGDVGVGVSSACSGVDPLTTVMVGVSGTKGDCNTSYVKRVGVISAPLTFAFPESRAKRAKKATRAKSATIANIPHLATI